MENNRQVKQSKSKVVCGLLGIFLGHLGIHRFYLGYIGLGVLKLVTAGGLGILYIIDIVNIATKKLQPDDGLGYEEDYQKSVLYGQLNLNQPSNMSSADEIIKYKELLDMGAITVEEFTKKKKEILGL